MTATPEIVDRETWLRERAALLVREKAHTRAGDAIAAARRRLPMVEVDGDVELVGANGPTALRDIFEGRDQLLVCKHMWHVGKGFEDQCRGCTATVWNFQDATYLEARGVTYAIWCEGPYAEFAPFREFMGYRMPWYSVYGVRRARHLRRLDHHLPAGRRADLPDVRDRRARLRGDDARAPSARHDGVRPAGGMGGLAARGGRRIRRRAGSAATAGRSRSGPAPASTRDTERSAGPARRSLLQDGDSGPSRGRPHREAVLQVGAGGLPVRIRRSVVRRQVHHAKPVESRRHRYAFDLPRHLRAPGDGQHARRDVDVRLHDMVVPVPALRLRWCAGEDLENHGNVVIAGRGDRDRMVADRDRQLSVASSQPSSIPPSVASRSCSMNW